MSKGLEAFEEIKTVMNKLFGGVERSEKALNTIEKELKEHEQYKDIEKELGVDLATLFKALKNGIYVKNRKNEIRRVSCNIGLVETGGCNSLGLRFQDTNYKWRYLVLDTSRDNDVKDYGKTWALTREELQDVSHN